MNLPILIDHHMIVPLTIQNEAVVHQHAIDLIIIDYYRFGINRHYIARAIPCVVNHVSNLGIFSDRAILRLLNCANDHFLLDYLINLV